MKIILKSEKSLVDPTFVLFTLDLEKYNNKFQRFELEEVAFQRIVNCINRELERAKYPPISSL